MSNQLSKKFPAKTVLFNEGDPASSMFLIRNGMVRVFKTKSDGFIEIDTLRAGQVVGEISFLDNNPRSASAETLTECELVEISQSLYQNTLAHIPEWLKALIRAIAARLRSTTTKLKNLEQSGTSVDYVDGNSRISYAFLTNQEAMKLAVATLAAAGTTSQGSPIKFSKAELIASGVFNISISKIVAFLDCVREARIISFEPSDEVFTIQDPKALEEWIQFTIDEADRSPDLKRTLSERALESLELVEKHMSNFPIDPATETCMVELHAIRKKENLLPHDDLLKPQELEELVNKGYFSQLKVISAIEQTALLSPKRITKLLRIQKLTQSLEIMNSRRSAPGRLQSDTA